MEKEPCTKFCGILVSSHEVTKLQSFESPVSDAVPANVQNISSLAFFGYFYWFYEKRTFSWTYESNIYETTTNFLLIKNFVISVANYSQILLSKLFRWNNWDLRFSRLFNTDPFWMRPCGVQRYLESVQV